MSGIEVAGLVLGALPLLISAIQYYNDGLHPIKVFFRKPDELDRFHRALGEQQTFLRQNLIELFGSNPSSLSEEQREALQDDSNDLEIVWRDKRLQADVERKLGLAYVPYMNNIDSMKQALEKLVNQKCLRIQNTSKILGLKGLGRFLNLLSSFLESQCKSKLTIHFLQTDRNSLQDLISSNQAKTYWTPKEIGDRIKFSSFEKKRMKLLHSIDESNIRLQTLMAQAQRVTSITQNWSRRRTDPLDRIRTCANVVYKALTDICNCHCPTPHSLRLQLQKLDTKKKDLFLDFCFRILFVAEIPCAPGGWAWQETAIYFHLSDEQQTAGKVTRLTVSKSERRHRLDITKLEHITDICTTLGSANAEDVCLSFLLDEKDRLLGALPSQKQWTVDRCNEVASLEKFLSTQPLSAIPKVAEDANRLSMRERIILALQLAISVLQLHSTPWLGERWGKRDIFFLRPGILSSNLSNTRQQQRPVDAEKPFVSQRLVAPSNPQQTSTTVTTSCRHPNPTLLDLGIILLELYFGQSIEQKRHAEDLTAEGQPHGNTDFNTARKWLDESMHDMPERYALATKHCIDIYTFNPFPRNTDLHDAIFREAMYHNVVIPLEEVLQAWDGIIQY